MNLQILEAASDDLLEGFDFYEHGGQGIGYYFLSCLYTDIESLRIFGGIHRQVYKNLHRALSKRFPFATDLRPSPPMPLVFEKDGFKFMF